MYWQLQLLCRWPDRALGSWLERHNYPDLVFAVRKPTKNMASFSVQEGNRVRRSPRARRLAFRLPPYDTPRVAPRNGEGGVCEQTKRLHEKYLYRIDIAR